MRSAFIFKMCFSQQVKIKSKVNCRGKLWTHAHFRNWKQKKHNKCQTVQMFKTQRCSWRWLSCRRPKEVRSRCCSSDLRTCLMAQTTFGRGSNRATCRCSTRHLDSFQHFLILLCQILENRVAVTNRGCFPLTVFNKIEKKNHSVLWAFGGILKRCLQRVLFAAVSHWMIQI